ncbi:DUF4221 family protein [Belliella aquatica]|uniref:6-bladed beta-propeller protein n=1 Tax=Belliella aquatica TaxID=1323734 RepID=A0ABQ1N7V0_9BACT|nr:DUF4221 family protein [Belliella aquatica]MCH7407474.1 DUF4221 domain-containing protein [Belliella aquatica]GGC53885.1 hypothetical protein GCM10010993_35370 [Belliella aquatica]
MRFIYLVIFSCFIQSCGKSTGQFDGDVSFIDDLVFEQELRLKLDDETSSYNLNMIHYDRFNDEILILPQGVNAIKRFSPETGEMLGQILLDVQGPNGVGKVRALNYVLEARSANELILYSSDQGTFSLINRFGKVLKRIRLKDYAKVLPYIDHFSKILVRDGLVYFYNNGGTFDPEDGSYYKVDFDKEELKPLNMNYTSVMDPGYHIPLYYELTNTLSLNGEIITHFPLNDTLYFWKDGAEAKKYLDFWPSAGQDFPKSKMEYEELSGKWGELVYHGSFRYFYNIRVMPEASSYLVVGNVGDELLENGEKKSNGSVVFILDKNFQPIAKSFRESDFYQYHLVRGNTVLLASLKKLKSEDELVFDVLALPK